MVLIVLLAVLALWWRADKTPDLRFADGHVFRIEAVSYGTNHVVGINDWWNVPLRKILPNSFLQHLTPERGQSRDDTTEPALVVWVHAVDAATGKYVDCQGVQASFVDKQGDVYPANSTGHGSFGGGFNRQAHTFYAFPRRPERLKFQLTQWGGAKETLSAWIKNPARQTVPPVWTAENIPAAHRVGEVEFRLESLEIHTNGAPDKYWETPSRHWQPVFRLTQAGQPAAGWEAVAWEATDPTGNRGQTLGLHEPVQKFIATTRPKPAAVTDEASRWQLPPVSLPTTTNGVQWNTNRVLRGASVTLLGLFPPGTYTFHEGRLTEATAKTNPMPGWTGMSQQVSPGKWKHWRSCCTTNHVVFLGFAAATPEQRVAVGLGDEQGQVTWPAAQTGGDIRSFSFEPPSGAQRVAVNVVVLEPARTEFTVKTPVP